MSSWSKRRRTLYATVILILLVGAVLVPAFFILYEAPSCSDGIQNGKEQGIDCGGSCQRLCASSFLAPSLAWTRFEEVAPGLYNVAAYIVNPNPDAEAVDVPYRMTLYDDRGIPIVDVDGQVVLPPHRNTLAFKGAVSVGKRVPAKALFQFTGAPQWYSRQDPLAALIIGDKDYSEDGSGSSLVVSLRNPGVRPIEGVAVYVILYDALDNAIGFSKTYVDEVLPQGTALAPFTWPSIRSDEVISIEVLPVLERP